MLVISLVRGRFNVGLPGESGRTKVIFVESFLVVVFVGGYVVGM